MNLVEADLTHLDDAGRWQEITRPGVAQAAVDALLGTGRKVGQGGLPGAWLVELSDSEYKQLEADGHLHLERGRFQLDAEAPLEREARLARERIWGLPV